MKRVSILMSLVAAFVLGSCTSLSSKSEIITDIDSLSYFFGMARADGVKVFLLQQAGVDTSYMEYFYKGFRDGAKHYGPEEVAYLEGKRIAHLINNAWYKNVNEEIFLGDSNMTLNRKLMLAGFYQGVRFADDKKLMQVQSISQMKMDEVKDSYKRVKYAEHIVANETFLVENMNKADVKMTESGLQYKVIEEGRGATPDERSKVKVNYRGMLIDGTQFDSISPYSFRVSAGIVKGWTEALMMMPVGSKWMWYVPQDQAYGSAGLLPTILPYSTLIFEIELLEIEPS